MSVSDVRELQRKYDHILATSNDPLEKVRAACLKRGVDGISKFGRAFKIFDDDRSHTLSKEEFDKAMHTYGVPLTEEEIEKLFNTFDKDGGGSLDFDEFLESLRPPMNDTRQAIVMKAFVKADKTGDGVLTVADLKGVYNVRSHKKYMSGEWDENRVLEEFLKNFDDKINPDNKVTKSEWFNYYSGVSASVDNDSYFDLMIRNAWKL